MLNKIALKNYKLFKDLIEIPVSNINLLTGINGRGKSTVLQSLLLMKQSLEYDRTTNKILFNGDNINLGNYMDVKNSSTSQADKIEFIFHYSENIKINYHLLQDMYNPLVASIDKISINGKINEKDTDIIITKEGNENIYFMSKTFDNNTVSSIATLYDLFVNTLTLKNEKDNQDINAIKNIIDFSRIHYLSADRYGPQVFHPMQNTKDIPFVGTYGENAITLLYNQRNEPVNKVILDAVSKMHATENEDITTVMGQTNYWLGRLFNGAEIKIELFSDSNMYNVSIKVDGESKYYKPTNVGFGISYVLPILVMGLISKPGSILIVENPEAHLHPFAQSMLAKYLAFVGMTGVQIFIESHSEHILNGLRIPICDNILDVNMLNVLYFDKIEDKKYLKINIDKNGGIKEWPQNFFDQSTNDINHLLGI